MRIKTIAALLITILLTVVLMQNTGRVNFDFLWATFAMSKLIVLASVALIGFILGVLVARPKRVKKLANDAIENSTENNKTKTLSDEDKDYIS